MKSASPNPPEPGQPASKRQSRREQVIVPVVIGIVLLYALWTLREGGPLPSGLNAEKYPVVGVVVPEQVPLVTGDEPLMDIFKKAGCPVCHTIPGVPGAQGQVGPALLLGTTGERRLNDPMYQGEAKTVREYIVESVVDPRRFVVPGFPDRTMPTWYGSKLSGLALEKMAEYLAKLTDESRPAD